jgi:Flp pilus assembly protein TadG
MTTPRRSASRVESGSAAVELVILTPLLAALLLFVAGLGRLAESRGLVEAAARDAARAASLERSLPAATEAGQAAARAVLEGQPITCTGLSVSVDVSGYRSGGQVTAVVRCTARLSGLALAGFPASRTQVARFVTPVEAWRGR